MKKIIFSFILLGFALFLNAQTVDSIKVEQAGDFIKIRYKILNSATDQVYRVKVLCSIDGGMNTEIRSISGDVGDQVIGGKNEYWIVWDVLKDVTELKSVEFIVRAELIKDLSETIKNTDIQWEKKRVHLMLAGDYPGPKFGLKIGYMGSWGISAAFLYGSSGLDKHWTDDPTVYPAKVPSVSLDITKRLFKNNTFQMHLMAGPTFSKAVIYNTNSGALYLGKEYGVNFGVIFDIKRSAITIGMTQFIDRKDDQDQYIHEVVPNVLLNGGFGIKF